MQVLVLGSAAGGGVPQWNCACDNCRAARAGAGVQARTQDSLAVSADGQNWYLLNASPDVTQQLARHQSLHPNPASGARAEGTRHSAVAGVILTNGDLDHCLGLLSLREWTPFSIYATGETHHGLVEYNAMLRTLQRQTPHAVLRQLVLDQTCPVLDAWGQQSGLSVRAFASPGNVPLHLRHLMSPSLESNVGLVIEATDSGGKIAYVPAAGSLENLKRHVAGVDCLFFDGTFWHDEELVELGLSGKTAAALAHVPISGPRGSLQLLRSLPVKRCVYVHINNTNPVLRDAGAERKMVEASGIAIAEDGMEFRL